MSTDKDLLAAIAAAPDDPEPKLVYADHRSALGDPHGELIVVQHRLAELEATGLWRDIYSVEAERLREREGLLVAALTRELDVRPLDATWRLGFIDTATLHSFTPKTLAPKLAHPALQIVRGVRFASVAIDLSPILEPIARSIVRTEGFFTQDHVSALSRSGASIEEAAVPIGMLGRGAGGSSSVDGLTTLSRLTLHDTDYEPTNDEQQLRGGWDARRALERSAEEHAIAELELLAHHLATWKRPRPRHLVIATRDPLPNRVVDALGHSPILAGLESVTFHVGHTPALAKLAQPLGAVRIQPQPCASRNAMIEQYAALRTAFGAWGRLDDAAVMLDDAQCLLGNPTPDGPRDALAHRVPALLNAGRIDRVLEVAPRHAGAWAMKGIALRAAFDLDAATAAFERALVDEEPEETIPQVARAYALFVDDPANALLGLPPSFHRDVLSLTRDDAPPLRILEVKASPIMAIAQGIALRRSGKAAAGRTLWLEIARSPIDPHRPGPEIALAYVTAFFAAVLAAGDPLPIRRAYLDWRTTAGRLRPRSVLVFDPLLRAAALLMPQVSLAMVIREVDRLRGAE